MPTNVYQKRKQGDQVIRLCRTVFQRPQYAKMFTLVAVNRIQNTKGEDESLKVEVHAPDNPKAVDTRHISVIAFTEENREKWEIILENEARTCAKKMRMVASRAKEVRTLEAM